MSNKVLIIGCGFLGEELKNILSKSKWSYLCARRTPKEDKDYINLDVTSSSNLAIPGDIENIVYMVSSSSYDEVAYDLAYVQGIKNVLFSLEGQKIKIKKFIFIASTAVYAQTDGSLVDEESETLPINFSGKKILEAENLLFTNSYLEKSDTRAISLRLAGIYGKERQALFREAVAGKINPNSTTSNIYTNRIHVHDAARAIFHVLNLEEPEKIYNVVDDCNATRAEVVKWIINNYYKEKAGEFLKKLEDLEDASQSRIWRSGNRRCSNNKLKQSGFSFVCPSYKEGYL